MIPEQRAAAERVRRFLQAGESIDQVYETEGLEAMNAHLADLSELAYGFMAEHPADEDEPVTLDRLEELFHDSRCNVVQRGLRLFVKFCGSVEVKSEGDARRLRAALEGK